MTICKCCDGDPELVCDHCGEHACWAGRLYCDNYKTANTTTRKRWEAKNKTIAPSNAQSIVPVTALVADARVERIEGLRDLAASIQRQAGELIALYLHNRNSGVQFEDGPDGGSMDYKLYQLQKAVNDLRDIIDPEREVEAKAARLEEQRKLR